MHPERLELARAWRGALHDLVDADVLSDASKVELQLVRSDHPMLRRNFYDLGMGPCSNTGVHRQIVTFKDSGDGSTAKGTLR